MRPFTLRPALLPPIALLAVAACGGGSTTAPPSAAPARGVSADQRADVTRMRLERAADGLLYTSESDHPFEYFQQPAQELVVLSVERFRALMAIPDEVPVEAVSVEEFLARHIERVDPADPIAQALVPRYRRLRTTLEHAVREPRVFRVGTLVVRCYAVGLDAEGNVVGLTTTAIET